MKGKTVVGTQLKNQIRENVLETGHDKARSWRKLTSIAKGVKRMNIGKVNDDRGRDPGTGG